MTAALIVNPASGRSNGKGIALAGMLRSARHVEVRVLDDFTALECQLGSLASAGVTDLFISAGDGTVQAIQTILAERSPFAALPRLGLFAHGTTNMTAANLGFRRRGLAAQAAFIRDPRPCAIADRPTLRAANPRDGRPRHGMFLGTGAVWRAVVFCQEAIHKAGLKGEAATFATLAVAIGRSLGSGSLAFDETRIDRGYAMTISRGGKVIAQGEQLMMVASTLDRLILRTRPFWGGAGGPLRASVFPYPLPSLARWLIPMMYGREDRKAPQGAMSFSGRGFEIETATPFVIDGEVFDPPQGEALRVEVGPVFGYIRG